MNLNWPERIFLTAVLLVTGGAILIALNALGVEVPLLSANAPSAQVSDNEDWDASPPPLPPGEAEDGLLAELAGRGGAAWLGGPGQGIGYSGDGAGPGGDGDRGQRDEGASIEGASGAADGAEGIDGKGAALPRDPMIDQMKAAMDLSDPGQVMAFLIASFTPRGTKLSGEDLEFMFEMLGKHGDWGLRNLLFTHLDRIGGEGVTNGVLAFLGTEKDRASLARALGTLKSQNDEASVAGLVKFLTDPTKGRLREVAFRNLLQTKNGSATDPLLQALDRAQDPRTKRYALAALSQLGGERGADEVLRYAVSSDPFERSIGQKGLRDIRSHEAVPALTDALARGSDIGTRIQVVRTLGKIRDVRSVASVGDVVLYDENRGIRFEGIKTLAQIGRSEAIPTLRMLAESPDEHASIKKAAGRAIGAIQRQEARRAARPQKPPKPRKPDKQARKAAKKAAKGR